MRRLPLATVGLCGLVTALLGPTASAGPAALEVTPVRAAAHGQIERFPVRDPHGRPAGTARWWVTDAGGNCCEVYLDTSRDGHVFEYGGEVPWFSGDAGRTWSKAAGPVPVLVGEGSIVPAPNGDVLGVVWDTEQDRLIAHKSDTAGRRWWSEVVPAAGEIFDRPNIAVAPGPFRLGSATVPYLSVLNLNTFEGEWSFISGDGLSYQLASWTLDESQTTPVVSWLPTTPNAALDWTQGHPWSEITSLARGALLRTDPVRSAYLRTATSSSCDTYLLVPPLPRWHCFRLPRGQLPKGPLVADSTGRYFTAQADGDEIAIGVSADGAKTWRSVQMPAGGSVVDIVLRASGRLHRLAVATQQRDAHRRSAFHVAVFDTKGLRPRLLRDYLLGAGDLVLAVGAAEAAQTNNPRVDFPSVAFLPDGRLVAGFMDSRHEPPQLAVLEARP